MDGQADRWMETEKGEKEKDGGTVAEPLTDEDTLLSDCKALSLLLS